MRRVLALTAASLFLLAGTASAHVTVNSPGATQGGFAKLTFRVPTEKDVPTTKLQVVFPEDTPFASVSVKPHAGWTYKVVTAKLPKPLTVHDTEITEAVSSITWTATSGAIKPGEFDEFEVSAGPLPQQPTVAFKALQTYSDGEVVRWIGGEDSDHPAPVLALAAAAAGHGTGAHASATPTVKAAPAVAKAASDDDSGNALGAVGIGLGILALLIALVSLALGRRA